MRVLAIAGSPRRQGNTDLLLNSFIEGVKAVASSSIIEKINLSEQKLRPCQECGGCKQTGRCIINDDMQFIYEQLKACELFIIASPVFFGCITAQVKTMIDRFQCWWAAKYLLKRPEISADSKKKGIFLSVGGMDKQEYFNNAKKIIQIYFTVINVNYTGDLFYPGVDEKGEIKNHPSALAEAFNLGKNIHGS